MKAVGEATAGARARAPGLSSCPLVSSTGAGPSIVAVGFLTRATYARGRSGPLELPPIWTSRGPHVSAHAADAPLSLACSGGADIIQEGGHGLFITFKTCPLKKETSAQRKLDECAAQKASVGESS